MLNLFKPDKFAFIGISSMVSLCTLLPTTALSHDSANDPTAARSATSGSQPVRMTTGHAVIEIDTKVIRPSGDVIFFSDPVCEGDVTIAIYDERGGSASSASDLWMYCQAQTYFGPVPLELSGSIVLKNDTLNPGSPDIRVNSFALTSNDGSATKLLLEGEVSTPDLNAPALLERYQDVDFLDCEGPRNPYGFCIGYPYQSFTVKVDFGS